MITTPPSKEIRSRKKKTIVRGGESFGGCGFGEKSKRDSTHDSSARENSGLQERLSTQEANQSDAGNGSLDNSGNGGLLQTPKDKHEECFDEWTDVGSGHP